MLIHRFYEKEQTRLVEFKVALLNAIQKGKTRLEAGGIGLENLVVELLQLDGYTAKILPKQHFEGFADADIEASRTDMIQIQRH